MDWFERLTGFVETDYHTTRSQLSVEGRELVSLVTGHRYGIGELELASLHELRKRVAHTCRARGRLHVGVVRGDVRQLHRTPEYASALFQVASQFNLLEMVSPEITPEDGVTRYQYDPTQGPACAIAAGAATVYRNYFAPVGDVVGQTRDRQLDGLADLGRAFSSALGMPLDQLWTMRNGYALGTAEGLAAINKYLRTLDGATIDELQSRLRIGLHWDVAVTDAAGPTTPKVSQAFCSALPVAYTRIAAMQWQPFAQLVLDAAYEATLLAGALNRHRGGSNVVMLTRLGGGAFGNDDHWIDTALRRAFERMIDSGLDVRIVSRNIPPAALLALASDFA